VKLFRWRPAELEQVEVAEPAGGLSARPASREKRTARLNADQAARRNPGFIPWAETREGRNVAKAETNLQRRMSWGPDWIG
jgi:hypothetical protein